MSFPQAAVLDDFDRASLGANWTGDPMNDSSDTPTIDANELRCGGTPTGAWWSASTFGPDSEIYFTIGTIETVEATGGGFDLFVRCSDPGTASVDGYAVHFAKAVGGACTARPWRMSTGAWLGDAVSLTSLATGDKVGIRIVSNTLSIWHKAAAGSWTQITQWAVSGVDGAGYVGILDRRA